MSEVSNCVALGYARDLDGLGEPVTGLEDGEFAACVVSPGVELASVCVLPAAIVVVVLGEGAGDSLKDALIW